MAPRYGHHGCSLPDRKPYPDGIAEKGRQKNPSIYDTTGGDHPRPSFQGSLISFRSLNGYLLHHHPFYDSLSDHDARSVPFELARRVFESRPGCPLSFRCIGRCVSGIYHDNGHLVYLKKLARKPKRGKGNESGAFY